MNGAVNIYIANIGNGYQIDIANGMAINDVIRNERRKYNGAAVESQPKAITYKAILTFLGGIELNLTIKLKNKASLSIKKAASVNL